MADFGGNLISSGEPKAEASVKGRCFSFIFCFLDEGLAEGSADGLAEGLAEGLAVGLMVKRDL